MSTEKDFFSAPDVPQRLKDQVAYILDIEHLKGHAHPDVITCQIDVAEHIEGMQKYRYGHYTKVIITINEPWRRYDPKTVILPKVRYSGYYSSEIELYAPAYRLSERQRAAVCEFVYVQYRMRVLLAKVIDATKTQDVWSFEKWGEYNEVKNNDTVSKSVTTINTWFTKGWEVQRLQGGSGNANLNFADVKITHVSGKLDIQMDGDIEQCRDLDRRHILVELDLFDDEQFSTASDKIIERLELLYLQEIATNAIIETFSFLKKGDIRAGLQTDLLEDIEDCGGFPLKFVYNKRETEIVLWVYLHDEDEVVLKDIVTYEHCLSQNLFLPKNKPFSIEKLYERFIISLSKFSLTESETRQAVQKYLPSQIIPEDAMVDMRGKPFHMQKVNNPISQDEVWKIVSLSKNYRP